MSEKRVSKGKANKQARSIVDLRVMPPEGVEGANINIATRYNMSWRPMPDMQLIASPQHLYPCQVIAEGACEVSLSLRQSNPWWLMVPWGALGVPFYEINYLYRRIQGKAKLIWLPSAFFYFLLFNFYRLSTTPYVLTRET